MPTIQPSNKASHIADLFALNLDLEWRARFLKKCIEDSTDVAVDLLYLALFDDIRVFKENVGVDERHTHQSL